MFALIQTNPFAFAVGIVAVILMFISFQINDRKKILAFLILGVVALTIHQLMLGALLGALANVITIPRNLIFYFKDTAGWLRHPAWPYLFAFILVIFSLTLWQGWYSALPALAVICSTIALWKDNTTHIRFISVLGIMFWIPYAVIIDSLPTLMVQLVVLSSLFVAIWRFDWK